MSLSNKLTLDKVDVNGKRVIMRYCRVSPPTQLIGCEINCRLLPNCRVGHDSADLCCMPPKTFCPVMQARRRQTPSQLCVNRPRPSTRLQEVKFSSRFHPCYVPVRRCCMDATDWCALNIRTHRNLHSPLCSIPSVRDEVWGAVDILSLIQPQTGDIFSSAEIFWNGIHKITWISSVGLLSISKNSNFPCSMYLLGGKSEWAHMKLTPSVEMSKGHHVGLEGEWQAAEDKVHRPPACTAQSALREPAHSHHKIITSYHSLGLPWLAG